MLSEFEDRQGFRKSSVVMGTKIYLKRNEARCTVPLLLESSVAANLLLKTGCYAQWLICRQPEDGETVRVDQYTELITFAFEVQRLWPFGPSQVTI